MTVEDLSPAFVRRFLDYVELDRHCSVATRNLRLSAIHSLARFIGMHSPVHLSWCSEVRSIPFKKTTKTLVGYLDKPEMDALLASPNRRTAMGARDYALLLFMYNSGARADEVAKLRSEEHKSALQSLMRTLYGVLRLQKNIKSALST